MNLTPEYFRATRQNYPAIITAAKELHAAGYVYQPHRGNKSFLTGWSDLADKPPLDIDSVFKSNNGECFNIGAVIAANPKGDAPNVVVDIDLHGVKDQKDRDDCMAAKKRLLGDLAPTTISGSGASITISERRPTSLLRFLRPAMRFFSITRARPRASPPSLHQESLRRAG